jgi:hypothetical protein
MEIAKLFRNGRCKALHLPGKYSFSGPVPVLFAVAALLSCSESTPPDGSGTFGIYGDELRPQCTAVLDRTDLVSPATVDTVNWGDPQKVSPPLNTDCPEDDSEISDDGQILFYYWSPIEGPDNNEILTGTTGVYYALRTGGPGEFGESRFIDLRKNTLAGAGDGHPRHAVTAGKMFFHSVRAENTGYQQPAPTDDFLDIYCADLTGTEASPAQNLGTAVNSVYIDGEPEISPDGTKLFFASNRPGGLGQGDIYYSEYSGGQWSAPVNVGEPINSADNDSQPAFAGSDPNTMYFTSDRNGIGVAIYRSSFNGSEWETPVLVLRGQVGSPSLTADGSLLYFVHVQTDNTPGDPVFGADIYYVIHK